MLSNYRYVDNVVWSAALGASVPTQGGNGRGISWRPPAYSLFEKLLSAKRQTAGIEFTYMPKIRFFDGSLHRFTSKSAGLMDIWVIDTERDIVLPVLSVCLSVRPSNVSTYNDQIKQDNAYGEPYFDGSSKFPAQGAGFSAP